MSDNKSKRKRYFSSNLMMKKRKDLCLQTGLKGFISTTNGNEKQCIRESYNILNEYADKIYGEENQVEPKSECNDEKKDVMDEFKSEIENLKAEQSKSGEKRFQAINTGVINCIFIKTNLEDPVDLLDHIVRDLFETKTVKTRFLIRMIPIEVTCKAYIDEVVKAFRPLTDKYFSKEPTTFCVVFNRRHNSNLDRDTTIKELADLVSKANCDHKVNLTNPTYTIMVEVIKNICALSVIRDYFQFCKYNLNSICGIDSSSNGKAEKFNEKQTSVKNENIEEASNERQNQNLEHNSTEDVLAAEAQGDIVQSVSQTDEKHSPKPDAEDVNCKGEPTPDV